MKNLNIILDIIKKNNSLSINQKTSISSELKSLYTKLDNFAFEIKVEESLERVRQKTTNMESADEINTVVETLFLELHYLNLGLLRCGIGLLDAKTRTTRTYSTYFSDVNKTVKTSGKMSADINPLLSKTFDSWLNGDTTFKYSLEGDELLDYYSSLLKANYNLPDSEFSAKKQYYFSVFSKEGGVFCFSEEDLTEDKIHVLKRFCDTFSHAYKRFSDLKTAENNALRLSFLLNELKESISYSKRIMRSYLVSEDYLNDYLNDYFVFFQPKDIVSGDFYWAKELNNHDFVLVVADSTGHGVPGAIMSLINITALEKSVETTDQPNEIFNLTRKQIIERLQKDGSHDGGKDGMDAVILSFNKQRTVLTYSTANNPIWIARKNDELVVEIIELKTDKMPVGKHEKENCSFSQNTLSLKKGDIIYCFSDGFADQFGGEKGKKFMSKNLRKLLAKNAHLPLQEQKALLEKTFVDWVGDLEQVDDVTVIGVRV